jgi:hypothetical protein
LFSIAQSSMSDSKLVWGPFQTVDLKMAGFHKVCILGFLGNNKPHLQENPGSNYKHLE